MNPSTTWEHCDYPNFSCAWTKKGIWNPYNYYHIHQGSFWPQKTWMACNPLLQVLLLLLMSLWTMHLGT